MTLKLPALLMLAVGVVLVLAGVWLMWPAAAILLAGIGALALGVGLFVEVD
jgi:hypothetical protein